MTSRAGAVESKEARLKQLCQQVSHLTMCRLQPCDVDQVLAPEVHKEGNQEQASVLTPARWSWKWLVPRLTPWRWLVMC